MPPNGLAPELTSAIEAAVRDALGHRARLVSVRGCGGAMSTNAQLKTTQGPLFIKTDRAATDRFAAEVDGLMALTSCTAVRVPAVIAHGAAAGTDFLILEWLDLATTGDDARLGAAIAELHRQTAETFGWRRDNYLGRTPQANARDENWGRFFVRMRLQPQLAAASRNWPALAGACAPWLDTLTSRLSATAPRPALLHGDLWRGNVGFVAGQPALFDPACHYGDGECDLAMAALFGGFSPAFFAAYRETHAQPADAELRRTSYQLYHVLNHVNLFGDAYLGQARRLIGQLASLEETKGRPEFP